MTDAKPTNGHSDTDANAPLPKWAIVITHMLNPNQIQGFPMHAATADDVHEAIEACLENNQPINVRNAEGELMISVILGAGMSYQIQPWDAFVAHMQAQQRAQGEAATAAKFGVVAPIGGGPRRPV
jgi:hypothetical protein